MEIKINDKKYKAEPGETILDVCRREDISIPTLCSPPAGGGKLKQEAICRLCLVEVNKSDKLTTSCTFKVCEGLEVITESEKIKKARNINMELLWSDHAGKCVTCKKNQRCELQVLAEEYKIENFHFVPRRGEITDVEERDLIRDNKSRVVVDDKNPVIDRTTEFCVECRRCVNICPIKSYGFNHRAGDTVVGTPYNETLDCLFCGACVKHCPTGALTDQNDLEKITEKMDDLKKMAVAILDPAILESIRYEFGTIGNEEKVVGLLKAIGFEKVFNLSWGLEEYINEMKSELKEKKPNQAVFSSYCPAFSRYIERYHPNFKSSLSDVKVPEEIMAKAIKGVYAKKEKINPEDIVVIAISSCTAKKALEYDNLDYILTVRELGRISRKKDIQEADVASLKYDAYFKESKPAEELMRSGGLLKAVGSENSVSVNSLKEFEEVMRTLKRKDKKFDFIEMMTCPKGCINGGGQAVEIK